MMNTYNNTNTIIEDLEAERVVETENGFYDLTFEGRENNKIVVYLYKCDTYETEVWDILHMQNNPELSVEENFNKTIDDYIKDYFGVEDEEYVAW